MLEIRIIYSVYLEKKNFILTIDLYIYLMFKLIKCFRKQNNSFSSRAVKNWLKYYFLSCLKTKIMLLQSIIVISDYKFYSYGFPSVNLIQLFTYYNTCKYNSFSFSLKKNSKKLDYYKWTTETCIDQIMP